MSEIPPSGNPRPIPPWYYRRGVEAPDGFTARRPVSQGVARQAGAHDFRRWIPGFRSGTWWKAVIACVVYALTLLAVVSELATAQWALAGFSLSLFAIGILIVLLISYWRVRLANIAILTALLFAFGGCGLSMANIPAQPVASKQTVAGTPGPTQPPKTTPAQIAQSTPTPTLTPTPTPSITPTLTPAPLPPPPAIPPPPAPKDLCGAPNNPWGYNFCGGATITSPPAAFCQYFPCIGNFWNGRGYVIECNDGMYSKSGGIQGSCSYHHGDLRSLYQ
jgi:hypothetical protein